MKSREKLQIYKENQNKLIKALVLKNREIKELKSMNISLYAICRAYEKFLTEDQQKESAVIANKLIDVLKKVM